MSLDLFVYGSEAVATDRIHAAIDGIEDVRLVGDVTVRPMSVVVERKLRGAFEYATSLDGPFDCEAEDLPPPVLANAVGITFMYQFVVEGSSRPSFKLAERLARELAAASSGVVYDPQEDAVTWPRSSTRKYEAPRDEFMDVVRYSWYIRREDGVKDLPRTLLREVETFVPEALPRRYGGYEPLQFTYEEFGEETFVEQWRAESMGLFWKATKPCFSGSTFGLAAELGRPPLPHPVGNVTFSFDSRAFDDQRWRRDLLAFFVSFAETSGAFCAVAEVDRTIRYTGGNLLHGPEAETHWGLAVRNEWQGLPPEEPWLLWFGPTYCAFLGLELEGHKDAGRLLQRHESPSQKPSRRRLRSLIRRGSVASSYDQVPEAARMISTGSPGRGGERIRAGSVPDGL